MKYPYTDGARRIFRRAADEARQLGHDYVGTEHILLGLIPEMGGVSAAVLDDCGVDREDVRSRVLAAMRPGGHTQVEGRLPYTSHAKKVIELAIAEAREMQHHHVGTEHLLLGLLRQERGIAARVLGESGVAVDETRSAILDLFTVAHTTGKRAWSGGFHFHVDDSSSMSIYEQIVDQFREAVATGELRPGQRLPPVRSLADELDIAPGTVARAYGELEQLGLVVTEGARGTRVARPVRGIPPESERQEMLAGLLRPVAVAAFHMGATASDLRDALGPAMEGILSDA
jgi:DNA-binding transcriptional regulator YhcF (GntR family)